MRGPAVTGPRVHGNAGGLVAPLVPPLTTQELRAALGPQVRSLLWSSPRPLAASGLVDLAGRTVLVKRHLRRVRGLEDLEVEHALAAHLRAAGLPVPVVLDRREVDGRTYEVHALGAGEDAYRDVPSWQPHRSAAHARATGAALGRLATAGTAFDRPARAAVPLVSSWSAVGALDLRAGLARFVGQRPALAAALAPRPWQRAVEEVLAPLHDRLREHLPDLPAGWTHGDGHPSNLLWDGDEVSAVLDLGLADRTTPLLDLAVALERSCVSWLDPLPRAHLGHAAALLDGWRSVRADDLAPLAELLPLCQVEFALSELAHFHSGAGTPDDVDAAWAFAVEHPRWWGSSEGRRLVDLVRRA